MVDQTYILQLIKIKGPVVPTQISKEIKRDTLLTSAILSQLVDIKKLRISKLKVGGSPLYFLDGQQQRLQSFVKYLDEKDQKTVQLLREKTILRDTLQEPLIRVSLRTIKDFAIPLHATVDDQKILFWKWYLAEDTEAAELIKKALGIGEKQVEPEPPKVEKEEHPKLTSTKEPPKKKELQTPLRKPEPKIEAKPLIKTKVEETEFLKHITSFFTKSKITVLNTTKIKKAEFDFEIHIDSPVGPLPYYCKAIQKSKVNEKDLSEVYVKALCKKLPGLVLITGELTKKAKEFMPHELKGLAVKQI